MVLQVARRRLAWKASKLCCDWQQGVVSLYNVAEACSSVPEASDLCCSAWLGAGLCSCRVQAQQPAMQQPCRPARPSFRSARPLALLLQLCLQMALQPQSSKAAMQQTLVRVQQWRRQAGACLQRQGPESWTQRGWMQAPALSAHSTGPAGGWLDMWAAHQIGGEQPSCVAAWSAWLRCCKSVGAQYCGVPAEHSARLSLRLFTNRPRQLLKVLRRRACSQALMIWKETSSKLPHHTKHGIPPA